MDTLTRFNALTSRRKFLGGFAAVSTLGACPVLLQAQATSPTSAQPNVLGPWPGYSPQIGSFVSMLTWMREANGILNATKNLKQADLDYLFDANANTVGALMLHLAATDLLPDEYVRRHEMGFVVRRGEEKVGCRDGSGRCGPEDDQGT